MKPDSWHKQWVSGKRVEFGCAQCWAFNMRDDWEKTDWCGKHRFQTMKTAICNDASEVHPDVSADLRGNPEPVDIIISRVAEKTGVELFDGYMKSLMDQMKQEKTKDLLKAVERSGISETTVSWLELLERLGTRESIIAAINREMNGCSDQGDLFLMAA